MIISKNPYDPKIYRHMGFFFDSVVFTSSLQSDFAVLTKSFRQGNIEEYEKMMSAEYEKFYQKIQEKLEAQGCDGLFNTTLHTEVLYAGTILLYASGDKVEKL
ncbi:MAG TPA: heavy metal-binding domain-containing protein [Clostridia bacterium]|nr:heavy metal-binding domain-containing protein [Clostridia bacterium]